jgi:hypothetical protein
MGSEDLTNVIRARGTVHLEWVKIMGGTGEYASDGSPIAGTGSGLAMGMASNSSSLYAVHITGSDAAGITNAHGTFERIELDDTTQDANFLGFTGSGLKAINEVEIRRPTWRVDQVHLRTRLIHQWVLFATIIGGPILLSIGLLAREPV